MDNAKNKAETSHFSSATVIMKMQTTDTCTPTGRRNGHSLVEVVIALLCFSIAIAGLCALSLMTKESADVAREHYIAVNIAKNRLERSHSFDFAQLNLFNESGVVVDHNGNPAPNGHYRRSTTVTNMNPSLYHIEVNVEILNRVSLQFDPGAEGVQTLVADIQ